MSTLKTVVLYLYLLIAFSTLALAQEKSLYERLGGEAGISAVVDELAAA